MKNKSKRGQSTTTAIGLVLFIVVLGIGALIVSSVGTTFANSNPTLVPGTNGTAEMNLTTAGGTMFNNMTGLIPVLGIVFIAGIVIFFVVRGLGSGTGVAGKGLKGAGGPKGGNF